MNILKKEMTKRAWLVLVTSALWLGVLCHDSLAASRDADGFLRVVTNGFQIWDKDHDGELTVAELNALVVDSGITGKEAAAVAALKRITRGTNYTLPPLTFSNIHQIAIAKETTNRIELPRKFKEGYDRITNAVCRDLFASGLPRLDTIHQGKLGNCFCLAPLGAMVHRDPRQVAAMFAHQEHGRYKVTLGTHDICVAPPTDTELAMTSSNERDGIWVNIYEKALGEVRNELKPAKSRVALPMDSIARGGSAGDTLSLITAHKIKRFAFKFANDPAVATDEKDNKLKELRSLVESAAAEKRLMTCSTLKPTTPGLTSNHAYAVLGYQKTNDAVTIWNPHGSNFTPKGPAGLTNGYPRKDGIFSVPLAEYVKQFNGMTFEVLPEGKTGG